MDLDAIDTPDDLLADPLVSQNPRAKLCREVDRALGGERLLELVALLPVEYVEGDDALTDLVVL